MITFFIYRLNNVFFLISLIIFFKFIIFYLQAFGNFYYEGRSQLFFTKNRAIKTAALLPASSDNLKNLFAIKL